MQSRGAVAEGVEDLVGSNAFLFGHAAGIFQTVDGGESDLVLRGVLAGGLAEGFGRFFDVEDVVTNLEGEADVLAVAGERGVLLIGGGSVNGAHAQVGAQ